MKHEQKPTLQQYKIIEKSGLKIIENWNVVKDCTEIKDHKRVNVLHIIHRHGIKVRKIYYYGQAHDIKTISY